jgi:uncharacterized protein (TIGR01244 family)
MLIRLALVLIVGVGFFAQPAGAQQITKENVPGAMNVARLETTVACAGATKAEAVPEIKKLGFVSIINLRLPNESGADIEAEAAAAKTAGIRFYSFPFNGQSPDPAVATQFLDTITAPGNAPAYIHCAAGNRAAAMWMIKRLVVDKWDVDRATQEAKALGMTSTALQQFAVNYAETHKR